MQYKNSVITGVLLGLVLPFTTWLVFGYLNPGVVLMNKPAIPYLIALALNLVIIRLCYKKNADQTGKGLMIATFAAMMILLFVLKIKMA
jgi:hypothetical protein